MKKTYRSPPPPPSRWRREGRREASLGSGKYRPGKPDEGWDDDPARRSDPPAPRREREGEVGEAVYDRLVEVWRREKRHCIFVEDFDTPPLRGFSAKVKAAALSALAREGRAETDDVFWAPAGGTFEREAEAYAPEAIASFVKRQKRTNEKEIWANLKLIWPVVEEALESLYAEFPPRIVKEGGVIKAAARTEI